MKPDRHDGPLLSLSPDQRRRLEAYADLVRSWSRRINLVAPGDLNHLWHRHILDSAQLADLLPPSATRLADLGSGAGFPGLVLALLTDRETHLVERDQRKAAFLREATRLLGAPATIHAEDAALLPPLMADVITARAFAPLPGLLPLIVRHLRPRGVALLPKGRSVDRELTEVAGSWTMRLERFPSRTDPSATILRVSEVARV
uniref:16S rRNA (guanine(527)-N(7))-methyltransferase RsmG n=1 Tax=Elioraea thermophila TaxID=2185104 RepID=UPI001E4602E4|nr:16S rRNA (guanine(527)-N(7))-methyltransferase RsmG [Elioraea thermophila]